MTEAEKLIIKKELRSTVINDSIGALVSGIVATVVTYLII